MTELKELNTIQNTNNDKKLRCKFNFLEKLIMELKKRDIPYNIVKIINQYIDEINSFSGSSKDLRKKMYKAKTKILNLLEKELKLVPKNAYRRKWMVLGMSIFGVPMGAAFGASLGNMAFLGIGIAVGMGIGIAIGAEMDKKAMEEGRQLDLEIKF